MSPAEVEVMVKTINARSRPPLPEKEVDTILASIWDSHQKKSRTSLLDGTAYGGSDEEREAFARATVDHGFPGLHLQVVRKITGDTVQYMLEFEEGAVLLSSNDIWSAKTLKSRVSDVTGVVIPQLSAKTHPSHDAVMQALQVLAITVDAGDESTMSGELASMVYDYLSTTRIEPSQEGPVEERGPFMRQGLIWINLPEFIKWVGITMGKPPALASLAQRFGAWGAKHKKWKTEKGMERLMYGITPAHLGRDVDLLMESPMDEVQTISVTTR
jgi:hypothetical protein